jgi:hypothetical protein
MLLTVLNPHHRPHVQRLDSMTAVSLENAVRNAPQQ